MAGQLWYLTFAGARPPTPTCAASPRPTTCPSATSAATSPGPRAATAPSTPAGSPLSPAASSPRSCVPWPAWPPHQAARTALHGRRHQAQPRSQTREVRRDPPRRRQRHVRAGDPAQAPRRPPHHHQGARLCRAARTEEDPPRARCPERPARPHRRGDRDRPQCRHRSDLAPPRRPPQHHRHLLPSAPTSPAAATPPGKLLASHQPTGRNPPIWAAGQPRSGKLGAVQIRAICSTAGREPSCTVCLLTGQKRRSANGRTQSPWAWRGLPGL
jgi:hypothetical protein